MSTRTPYYKAMNVLQDEDDFFELAWRYLCKAASQNVVYAEMFFDPQAHTGEIRRMIELGMRATVNSDDPASFRAYMNENLQALVDDDGFTRGEIVQLVTNAFQVAWLDEKRRSSYLERVQAHVAKFAA